MNNAQEGARAASESFNVALPRKSESMVKVLFQGLFLLSISGVILWVLQGVLRPYLFLNLPLASSCGLVLCAQIQTTRTYGLADRLIFGGVSLDVTPGLSFLINCKGKVQL